MSHPPNAGTAKDFGQTAKLALIGLGTLATGAFGILGLAAGYRVKRATAPDPEKVTPQTYFDDLVHLVPPWQHQTNRGETDDENTTSSSTSHRTRETESKHRSGKSRRHQHSSSDDNELADDIKHRADLDAWELMNETEERELTWQYDAHQFHDVAALIPLPLSAKSLCHVCSFLPYESVVVLSSVSKTLQTFSNRLLAHPGFQLRIARSKEGFNEVLRGPIWLRITGAQITARRMAELASPTAKHNFYEHLLALSIDYREQIVKQNTHVGLRSPLPGSSPSPSPPVDPYQIDGLSPENRSSLDTILKDVPRTMVPSNPASHSLISNLGSHEDAPPKRENDIKIILTQPPPPTIDTTTATTSLPPSPSSSSTTTISTPVANSSATSPSSSSSSTTPALNKVLLDSHLQSGLTSLSHLLSVYSLHDRELGYCQGMNFISAFFLSKLPEQDAYWLFYTVMNDPRWNLRSFYLNDLKGLLLCKYQFNFLFQLYLPELYHHFQQQDIHSDIFTEWFMTFFTYASFPRRYPLIERIWDAILIMGGTKMLHRAALSILYLSQQTLLQYDFEEIIYYLKTLPDSGILNPEILMPLALDYFKISNAALKEIEKRYEEDIRESEESRKRKIQIEARKAKAAAAAAAALEAASSSNPNLPIASPPPSSQESASPSPSPPTISPSPPSSTLPTLPTSPTPSPVQSNLK